MKKFLLRGIERLGISSFFLLISCGQFATGAEATIALGEIELMAAREYRAGYNSNFLANVSPAMRLLLEDHTIVVLTITKNGKCYFRTRYSGYALEDKLGTNSNDYAVLNNDLKNEYYKKYVKVKYTNSEKFSNTDTIAKLFSEIGELKASQDDKNSLFAAIGGGITGLPYQQQRKLKDYPDIGDQVKRSMMQFRSYEYGKSQNIQLGKYNTDSAEGRSGVINWMKEFRDEPVDHIPFAPVHAGSNIYSAGPASGFRLYVRTTVDPNSISGNDLAAYTLRALKNKAVHNLLEDKDLELYYGFDGSKAVTKIDKTAFMEILSDSSGIHRE